MNTDETSKVREELLAALHTVCRELNRGHLVKGHGRNAYEAAVAAILKAEGVTP